MLGEENILFLLVFVIGGIIFGALIMYLIMDARRSKSAGKEAPTQPYPMQVNSEIQPEPAASGESEPASESLINRKKLLSFWKEPQSGTLTVYIDEQWFENTAQMNPAQRTLFERTLREGSQWLDMVLTKPRMETAENNSASSTTNAQPAVVQAESSGRTKSIVEQIDEILQELLEKTPLKEQNIRLTEMYNKGVVVWIGQKYYEGLDGVPDEQVKSLIKMAVKKWEADNSSR